MLEGLREGDRVVAWAAGCFASHVVARRELVQLSPAGLTDEEAAALPIAYLTAMQAIPRGLHPPIIDKDRSRTVDQEHIWGFVGFFPFLS